MILTCPKCKTVYRLDDSLIPEEGRKVHCFNCGNLWVAYKPIEKEAATPAVEDMAKKKVEIVEEIPVVEEEINIDADDVEEIFSSFSIRREDSLDPSPIKPKRNWWKLLNWLLFIALFIAACCTALYYFRFDIVKKFPQTEVVYNHFGINSLGFAQGLSFEEVEKVDLFPQVLISGFIKNNNFSNVEIPTISVQFLDDDKEIIKETKYKLETTSIKSGEKLPFNATVDKPEYFKYIIVTFVED